MALSVCLLLLILNSGCATYYQKNQEFNDQLYKGNTAIAYKKYIDNKVNNSRKNIILRNLNLGTLNWMMGNYATSIEQLNTADLMIEDQRKSYSNEALALITNPGVKAYKAEDFESIMTNQYKALAYLQLNQRENALVECRRINEKLYSLNEKYKKNQKNKYSDDAFGHLMMGIIYEAEKDYNNAFIAYRNAYKIYETIYKKRLNTNTPQQLKQDIVRSAYKAGLRDEYLKFSELFSIDYQKENEKSANVVVLWMSGLSPYKSEFSINLTSLGGTLGYINFQDNDKNIAFPVYIGNLSKSRRNDILSLSTIRIAFPKYVERPLMFSNAVISCENKNYQLEKVQDINSIAFLCLKDRMMRDISNSILRLAIKKTAEQIVRGENEYIGLLLGIVNAATESADTRNWQTLPHSIFYTRINIPPGNHNLKMNIDQANTHTKEYDININKGETKFIIQQDL